MFAQDKAKGTVAGKKAVNQQDAGVTILTSGCHFTGKLFCRGATRIGGTIEGQVIAAGLLVVEDEAVITGDVDAEDIVVHGRIEGKIEGRNRVELCSTADVHAEISTPSLVIHDGALFNGKTSMKRAAAALESSDTKSSGKGFRLGGSRKVDIRPDNQSSGGMPDIRAARVSDEGMSLFEPEPAV